MIFRIRVFDTSLKYEWINQGTLLEYLHHFKDSSYILSLIRNPLSLVMVDPSYQISLAQMDKTSMT